LRKASVEKIERKLQVNECRVTMRHVAARYLSNNKLDYNIINCCDISIFFDDNRLKIAQYPFHLPNE